jgi:sulfite reductase (NADPH) flavoprotein alpha-component
MGKQELPKPMTHYHRTHPFPAKIKDRYCLTKSGSTKATYHVTLDIAGSGLTFKVGDSLGIYAHNDPEIVGRILNAFKLDPETPVMHPRTNHPFLLKDYLETQANLARVGAALIKQFDPIFDPAGMDVVDLALRYGHLPFELPQFLAALSPLLPRFYSVASSQLLHPDEVHLLVALTTFEHNNELRYGVASHFLCHRAEEIVPCYVQPTPHFTLPESHEAPIIMVGPGTGVAPFRAFLQERLHHNAPGKNWLFFGERNQKTDFFYEEYWTSLAEQKKLYLDLAFSRDQADKLYVQHRLLEKGLEIWSWLEEGAHFYVFGDADPMAKEVESAILQICTSHGRLSSDDAKAYLKKLRHEKRYLADVY